MAKRVWLVLPDPLPTRVFFDCGIVDGLAERLGERLDVVLALPRGRGARLGARGSGRVPWISARISSRLASATVERVAAPDRPRCSIGSVGYYPLAIRHNLRHGFHRERMRPGHPNWLLDSARDGPLPRLERRRARDGALALRRAPLRAARALAAHARRVRRARARERPAARRRCRSSSPRGGSGCRSSRTSRAGITRSARASISPHCDALRRPERRDARRSRRATTASARERIVVTGWPQTDVFASAAPARGRTTRSLARLRARSRRGRSCSSWGTRPTNAPYEERFVERLVGWWEAAGRDPRPSLLFRPHPRDREWRERVSPPALDTEGVAVQEPSYTDLEMLATLLQHVRLRRRERGDDPARRLVNDRPAVCVLYDEGAPPGESCGAEERDRRALPGARGSDAFYRAERFDEVVAGIERALAQPDELADGAAPRRARGRRRGRRPRRRARRRRDRRDGHSR